MTQENIKELRQNVRVGYGFEPWHYVDGESPAPFAGPVPEDEVIKIFPRIATTPVKYTTPEVNADGSVSAVERVSADRVVIYREDTGEDLGAAKSGFTPHQYEETLAGLDLPIASAGIIKNGAVAWIQYGNPDLVTTPENVQFQTKVLISTSADGTLATTVRKVSGLVVCDNTLEIAHQTKALCSVRHTKNSLPRVDAIRKEFGLLEKYAEDVAAVIDEQIHTSVTNAQVDAFLAELFPAAVAKVGSGPDEVSKRANTIAEHARDAVNSWRTGQWSDHANDAFGLLQSVDSYRRWNSQLRGIDRHEKVDRGILSGAFDSAYEADLKTLEAILA